VWKIRWSSWGTLSSLCSGGCRQSSLGRSTMLGTPQWSCTHNGPFSGPKSTNERRVYPEYLWGVILSGALCTTFLRNMYSRGIFEEFPKKTFESFLLLKIDDIRQRKKKGRSSCNVGNVLGSAPHPCSATHLYLALILTSVTIYESHYLQA
jgi:hypothetical protein